MLNFFFKRKNRESSPASSGTGFTLIELLVVIAIIGLLMVLVLVSMSTNREHAKDTSLKSELLEITKLVELIYVNTGTYAGTCDSGELTDSGSIGRIKDTITVQGGTTTCYDSDDGYAVISTMNQLDCWCIDWQGTSKLIELTGTDTCADVLTGINCP